MSHMSESGSLYAYFHNQVWSSFNQYQVSWSTSISEYLNFVIFERISHLVIILILKILQECKTREFWAVYLQVFSIFSSTFTTRNCFSIFLNLVFLDFIKICKDFQRLTSPVIYISQELWFQDFSQFVHSVHFQGDKHFWKTICSRLPHR